MSDTNPPTPPAKANFALSQPVQVLVGIIVVFVAGLLASSGLISEQTKNYLGSPETLAVIGTLVAALVGAWRAIVNRPHGIIKTAANLPQVDAVIAKPKTAREIPLSNVVASTEEAASLPGIRRVRTHMTGPNMNPMAGN